LLWWRLIHIYNADSLYKWPTLAHTTQETPRTMTPNADAEVCPNVIQFALNRLRRIHYKEAAASTAPVALNNVEFVIVISTGYFHSMYFAHPAPRISNARPH
jgi:hypothetical protein